MKKNSIFYKLSLLLCIVSIAAMTLFAAGCASTPAAPAGASFTVKVTDLEGVENTFSYTSDKATVGEALLAEGLIQGDSGEYGLYVITVNGISADWDKDQTYWAFYIDGEYASTGVDATKIADGATYAFVLTKAEPEAPQQETQATEPNATEPNATEAASATVLGEGETVITVKTVDLEGVETTFEVHTNAATVGDALTEVKLIEGHDSEYGLYVDTVNGITLDWEKDGKYWAFYINGEYASTGVDATEISAGAEYSFRAE